MDAETPTTTNGMSTEQVTSTKTALESAGSSIMTNFVAVLPAIAGLVGISFAIYFITKQINKLKKGK